MDGWMDGQIDTCMDEWMDSRYDGQTISPFVQWGTHVVCHHHCYTLQ